LSGPIFVADIFCSRPACAEGIRIVLSDNTDTSLPAALHHASDLLYVERLIARDSVAWREFVRVQGCVIRARVADVANSFGFACDSASIDDATAEVFAALVEKDWAVLRAFSGRSSLRTYLSVIAVRCATRQFARRRHLQRRLVSVELVDVSQSTQQSEEMNCTDIEEHARVVSLLDELPAKQRDVIRLFYLEKQSYLQISERLNMPVGSIGVTIKRAEERLKRMMERYE
jgi:RNA polymerase sigma-70 factor (ECF subfamily)